MFGPDAQGTVGLAAVLVEASEKFQKLQAHIVDIAAQQVQRQVQHIADECDDDEGDHVAGGGAQHIEHLDTLDHARMEGLITYVQYVENGCVYFTEVGLQEYIARSTHRARPKDNNPTFRKKRTARSEIRHR